MAEAYRLSPREKELNDHHDEIRVNLTRLSVSITTPAPAIRLNAVKNVPLTSLPNWLSRSAGARSTVSTPEEGESSIKIEGSRVAQSVTPGLKRKKMKENQKRPKKRLFHPVNKIIDYFERKSI
jgi:hypothetical protein